MYFSGIPLVEANAIDKASLRNDTYYFEFKTGKEPFAEKIFERVLNNNVDLVVYENATWNDERLMEYHKKHYAGISYYILDFLTDRAIKTTVVKDFSVSFYSITHFSNEWYELKSQIYDNNFNLYEYREFIYDENNKITGERTFFTSSWHVSKEMFGEG